MNFKNMDELLDFMEFRMVELGNLEDCEVRHRFSPGCYTREAHAPAESLVVSLKHKTDHQFIVTKGKCAVFVDGEGWMLLEAPFHGLTKRGTRRLIYVLEDLVWTSIHPTDKTDIKEIEKSIIEERTNKFIKKALES